MSRSCDAHETCQEPPPNYPEHFSFHRLKQNWNVLGKLTLTSSIKARVDKSFLANAALHNKRTRSRQFGHNLMKRRKIINFLVGFIESLNLPSFFHPSAIFYFLR